MIQVLGIYTVPKILIILNRRLYLFRITSKNKLNNVSFYTNSTVMITGSAFIAIKVKRPISYWHYIYINWPLRFTIKLFFLLFKQWYMIAICRLNNIVKTHSLQSHFSLFLWLTKYNVHVPVYDMIMNFFNALFGRF